MPDALVTTTELAIHNDWPADTYPQDRALQMIWAATAMIQAETGQRFTAAVNDAATVYAHTRTVRLPQRPVTAVTQVVAAGVTYTNGSGLDWTLVGDYLTLSMLWSPGYVTVTYSHGYVTIPEQVKWVCCAAATRLLDNPGSLFSGASGGESAVFPGIRSGDGMGPGLLPSERAALGSWRELLVH